jgi:hypothetical protein
MRVRGTSTALLSILAIGINSCNDATGPNPRAVPALLEAVGGDEQTVTVGKELPNAITVRVLDDAGSPIEGQIINFRVTRGGRLRSDEVAYGP